MRDLVRAGEAVVPVSPKLMTGARRSTREPDKSDPIDALALARAPLREPDLPAAQLDGPERDLRLPVDHRDDLVAERTRVENRLCWHLHELEPGSEPVTRSLDRAVVLDRLEADLTGVARTVARRLIGRIRELTAATEALAREIARPVPDMPPALMTLAGWGPLTAAKLRRRGGPASAASARLPRSPATTARRRCRSGPANDESHRLSRSGNRQLNLAIHRISVTQMRIDERARTYIARRRGRGDPQLEAIRALRRHLNDEVFGRSATKPPPQSRLWRRPQ